MGLWLPAGRFQMYFGTVWARGLSLGGDGSLTVLLLLLLLLLLQLLLLLLLLLLRLLSLVSPATCSSPAVVYPCRSGDVQREEGDAGPSSIRSSEVSNLGLVSSRARGCCLNFQLLGFPPLKVKAPLGL